MIKNSIAKLCAAASLLALPTLSWAADKEVASPKGKNVIEETKESCITGDIGLNVVSAYVSRGLVLEDQGAILEPYADLFFQIYKGDGFLNKASVNVGVWDSFHSNHTDAGGARGVGKNGVTTPQWYESDFTAGVALTFAKNFTLTPSYYTFLSPSSAFETFQGLNINLAYDDTDLLGKFALHPHLTYLRELENKAGSGHLDRQGNYYEVGIAPAIPAGPVTFTLPVTAGFGSGDFYQFNAGFGYISAGVQAAYPLAFIPKCLGVWTATGGFTYYYQGHGTRQFDAPSTGGDVKSEDRNQYVFSGGLGVTF